MQFIVACTMIGFLILIIWIWHNLGNTEKHQKVIYIGIGIAISYIITLIIFNISKEGIQYQNHESEMAVQNMLVIVFTLINSLILVPYCSKTIKEKQAKEIKQHQFQKKMLIIVVIFILCAILESGYLKDTQKGILKVYETRSEERY